MLQRNKLTAGDRSFQEILNSVSHNFSPYKAAWKFLITLSLVHQYSSTEISTEKLSHMLQYPDSVKISLVPE